MSETSEPDVKRRAYVYSVASHVPLPFFKLVHPVEDGVERTDDQRRAKFQVFRQQHRVEEGHHLQDERSEKRRAGTKEQPTRVKRGTQGDCPVTCRVFPRPMQCASMHPDPCEELASFTDSQQQSHMNWTPWMRGEKNSKVRLSDGRRAAGARPGPDRDRVPLKTRGAKRTKKSGAVLRLTVHLVGLQAGHQVPVHLNKGRPGLFVLIQDQLGGDGKRALGHLSPVLHLLFPVGQAPASLLLLSESLLGLRAEVLVVHYPADLSAASGRAFKARLAVGIRFIALFDLKKNVKNRLVMTRGWLESSQHTEMHEDQGYLLAGVRQQDVRLLLLLLRTLLLLLHFTGQSGANQTTHQPL